MALLALILILFVTFLIYKWSIAKYDLFTVRGIPHDKPSPFIGNLGMKMMLGKSSLFKVITDMHQKYKNSKVYGFYNMRDAVILINDPELLKKVGVKDFDNFMNHKAAFSSDDDSVFNKSLIVLKDRKWKDMRNTLTPSFTGSKMRLMFELINECSLAGVNYLATEAKMNKTNEYELDIKDFFTRFANDVIASAAFGIKINSFVDKENDFYKIGKVITQLKGLVLFKALLASLMPNVIKALGIKVFDGKNIAYFTRLVLDAIKYREEHQIVRPDMIQLLMEAKKQFETDKLQQKIQHAEFNDNDLVAQCLLFFFAGFDTVSNCLCFTAHELQQNPEVQQRLYEEILLMEQELDGKPLNYDAIMRMKYMDMVLSESLRKWPPAPATDRICANDYDLTDDDGNVVLKLKKGDNVWVPISGLHHDSENFPNPMNFDPERFSDENKSNIKPLTYLPFGIGPRSCIGNRLALMETKSIVYHMLLRFKIVASPKTCDDLYNSLQGFQFKTKTGFWLKFIPRGNSL